MDRTTKLGISLMVVMALFVARTDWPPKAVAMPLVKIETRPAADEVECLARNIYHEARSESVEDQITVATVTINWAKRTGRTICEEVHYPYRYSWTLENEQYKTIKEATAYRLAKEIAYIKLSGDPLGDTSAATHFYEYKKVSPKWAKKMVEVRRSKTLVFVKEVDKTL